ncbi:DUF11 domain-containing protein [Vibrio sp. J1-1]|uniref:DUF11 domain-containing protein n=1 Tax=Vibrio sp. J1-1 TaxID=2912251 RepID=UPI001F40458D|nr:DUF11 domain-containing protein [Vibrio sp. J1-1]MCF7483393.1 DUF11 domain-containing protein [Vibrio sp. J1-1]
MDFATRYTWKTLLNATLVFCISLFTAVGAIATPSDGIFELEASANFWDDSEVAGDDWGTPPLDGDAKVYTNIDDTDLPDDVYGGGKKNTFDIPDLSWVNGSILDKGNILHAYAAAYEESGDLIINFAALREGTNGDAFMGFWFYQDDVSTNADGSFEGEHMNGDVLIQVNYLQSANLGPEILVLEWDDTCTKQFIDKKGGEDDCVAENLRLKKQENALCNPGSNQLLCASTNTVVDPIDGFPIESFFEGGINLTQVLDTKACFSAFAAETRASSSITAQLKDFAMDSFELCSIDVTKECSQGRVNDTETGYEYDFSGKVINDGVGTLYNVVVIDTEDPVYKQDQIDETDNYVPIAVADILLPGAEVSYSGTIESTAYGLDNTVIVMAAPVDTDGAEKTVTDMATDDCQGADLNASLSVNKDCTSKFIPNYENSGVIAIGVGFSGQVCNTHKTLTMVLDTIFDDKTDTIYKDADMQTAFPNSGIDLELAPAGDEAVGECVSYYGSYTPDDFDTVATNGFRDTVTAKGHLKVKPDVTDTVQDTADCSICEDECPDCGTD